MVSYSPRGHKRVRHDLATKQVQLHVWWRRIMYGVWLALLVWTSYHLDLGTSDTLSIAPGFSHCDLFARVTRLPLYGHKPKAHWGRDLTELGMGRRGGVSPRGDFAATPWRMTRPTGWSRLRDWIASQLWHSQCNHFILQSQCSWILSPCKSPLLWRKMLLARDFCWHTSSTF